MARLLRHHGRSLQGGGSSPMAWVAHRGVPSHAPCGLRPSAAHAPRWDDGEAVEAKTSPTQGDWLRTKPPSFPDNTTRQASSLEHRAARSSDGRGLTPVRPPGYTGIHSAITRTPTSGEAHAQSVSARCHRWRRRWLCGSGGADGCRVGSDRHRPVPDERRHDELCQRLRRSERDTHFRARRDGQDGAIAVAQRQHGRGAGVRLPEPVQRDQCHHQPALELPADCRQRHRGRHAADLCARPDRRREGRHRQLRRAAGADERGVVQQHDFRQLQHRRRHRGGRAGLSGQERHAEFCAGRKRQDRGRGPHRRQRGRATGALQPGADQPGECDARHRQCFGRNRSE